MIAAQTTSMSPPHSHIQPAWCQASTDVVRAQGQVTWRASFGSAATT